MNAISNLKKSLSSLISKPVILTPYEVSGLLNEIAESAGKKVVQVLNKAIKGRDTKESAVWDLIVCIETYVAILFFYYRGLVDKYDTEYTDYVIELLAKEAARVLNNKYKSGTASELFSDSYALMKDVYLPEIPVPIVDPQHWDEDNCITTLFVQRIITSTFIFYTKSDPAGHAAMRVVAMEVSYLFKTLIPQVNCISTKLKVN